MTTINHEIEILKKQNEIMKKALQRCSTEKENIIRDHGGSVFIATLAAGIAHEALKQVEELEEKIC